MSDLIPERPDRAIARLLAGGLTDTPEGIARDLATLLTRAHAAGVEITIVYDSDDATGVVYGIGLAGGPGSDHIVRYSTDRSAWSYTID